MPKKLFVISSIFFFVCLVGGCLYFVGGVSATLPPIRTYEYAGSISQLSSGVKDLLKSDSSIKFEESVRDSSRVDEGSYRDMIFTVITKDTIRYDLVCERVDESKVSKKTVVKLVAAISNVPPYGGYSVKGVGVNRLLKKFEKEIVTKLKTEKNIALIPDTSFWTNFSIY